MTFDGDKTFTVQGGFARIAREHYGAGEIVPLAPWEDRSHATHGHQFAWLHDAWMNLPEALAEQFSTPKALRKRALILAGYYDEMLVDAGSNAAALRVAAAFRSIDDFAHVVVRGSLVVRRTAKSQSRRHMDAKTFQESKQKVLEIVSDMIGVSPAQLEHQGEPA